MLVCPTVSELSIYECCHPCFFSIDDRGYYNQTLTESEANSWSDVEDERSRSRSREPEQNTKVG